MPLRNDQIYNDSLWNRSLDEKKKNDKKNPIRSEKILDDEDYFYACPDKKMRHPFAVLYFLNQMRLFNLCWLQNVYVFL